MIARPRVADYRGVSRFAVVPVSLIAALAVGVVSLVPVRAEAAPVSLDFAAPPGCPAEAEFRASVVERGGRFDGPEAEARVRGLSVRVVEANGGFLGSLRVEEPSGASDVREVRDAACAEVVRGLAVVAAIALGSEPEAGDRFAPPETSAEPREDATVGAPVPPAPTAPPSEPKPHLIGSSYKRLPRVKEVEAGTVRFDSPRSYTLTAGFEYGLVPKLVLPRIDFMTTLANFVTTPDGQSRMVGPIIQIHWSWAGPATRRFADHETRAMALRVSADLCGAPTYDSDGFVLLLCAELGGGVAFLRTRSLPDRSAYEQEKNAGFGFGALAADARYNLGSVVHVGVRAGMTLQLGDVTAESASGRQLFKSSTFGAYGVAGIGVHF